MAGRRTRSEVVAPSAALVASAVNLSGFGAIKDVYRPAQAWQDQAWGFYDEVPELRFAANWIANGLARCRLAPAELDDHNVPRATEDRLIREAWNSIVGNSDGEAELLHSFGLNLSIAGECYMVQRTIPGHTGKFWELVSTREIGKRGANEWWIRSSIDGQQVELAPTDNVIRIYRPHPSKKFEADSSVRSLLGVLTEIRVLTAHITAQAVSRLAGAGLQVLPNSIEFPGMEKFDNKAQGVLEVVGKAMETAIKDPSSASAQVPVMLLVNDEAVDKIKPPIHYWSPFDEKAVDARRAALARFAVGFDLPPEVIAGMSAGMSTEGGRGTGLSHWGQWQIAESAIQMHLEPTLGLVINAVVLGWIRKVTKNPRATLLPDVTALKLQPDRSKEASEAFDRGELNSKGLRYYNGLSEDYAPDDKDRRNWILRKMATGSASPEMVAEAAKLLGADVPTPLPGAQPAPETRPTPSLVGHPTRTKPDRAALLTATAEPLVLRALEKAGNRLRQRGVKPPDTPSEQVYLFATVNGNAADLVADAWSYVPVCANGLCDADKLTEVLQSYTLQLLTQKEPYDRETLTRYLTLMED